MIMFIAAFSILFVNEIVSSKNMTKGQLYAFNTKIDQMIQTMEYNQLELAELKESLDEDYLTRAKAFAYIIEKNPSILSLENEINEIVTLLDVDELHVIDEQGIIISSSIEKYIGLDFHEGEQTSEFLSILEADDKESYLIQDARPNAAEGKIMKYVGVARVDQKGIVQVGISPTRLLEAQERNTYNYLFSKFPTGEEEIFFVLDKNTGELLGTTNQQIDMTSYTLENIQNTQEGDYRLFENKTSKFIVTREYEDIIIGATVPKSIVHQSHMNDMLLMTTYLGSIGIIIVLTIRYLLERKVVTGIHQLLSDLRKIKNGNLETKVHVSGNPEFIELSTSINDMVKSLIHATDRMNKIIDMTEIPMAAFEYQKKTERLYVTERLRELLHFSKEEAQRLYSKPALFLERIHQIQADSAVNEPGVSEIVKNVFIRIRLVVDENGYYGAVNDVTKDIQEKKYIQYENNHDQLTGICRYTYFRKQVDPIINTLGEHHWCAAVMIDLDHFKQVNDTYGHDFGDEYLKSFAHRLKEIIDDHCIICRRSGDEFSLFIYNCQTEEEVQERLNTIWNNIYSYQIQLSNNQSICLKASGGVAITNDPNTTFNHLMREADQSLYKIKNVSRGNIGL